MGRLGKYELLDEIGHGGMATVTRARDTHLDRLVALKVLHPHLRGAEEARSRFAREARSVARLHHPNILEIYDYSGEESDESYLVMELLSGPTLKRWAETHPGMPAEIAAAFTIEILAALDAAHAAGIVHRDVKPENVLLHEARDVKLTDFGIAQMVDAQTFTATGQLLGSPCHMAPEQIERGDADARSDVFAAGTVLYFLATGTLPFAGKNPHQVMKQVVDGKLVDPLRLRPEIGARLRAILLRAMATNPADRYPDAGAFAADLRAFLTESGVDDPPAVLRRYLRAPEAVAAEVVQTAIVRLTHLGEAAAARGDVPRARDAFERVLALDEGNERVLGLVAGLGRARRQRARLAAVVGGVAAVAAAVTIVAVALERRTATPDSEPAVEVAGLPGRGIDETPVTTAAPRAPEAPSAVAGPAPGRAPAAGREDARRSAPAAGRRRAAASGPREVRFAFQPMNVQLAIDGGELRQVGPDYSSVELSPGRHAFRIESRCCESARFVEHIPPGTGPYTLRRSLQYQAGLLVESIPADVFLDGERIGRAGQLHTRPIDGQVVAATLRVAAPGYRPFEDSVRLRAGITNRFSVNLLPVEGEP